MLLGTVSGVLAGKILAGQIRPIEALDPSVIIAVVFILAATTAVAAILPTLHAAKNPFTSFAAN